MSEYRIPTEVSHADFLTAIQPLLDLLGVTNKEIYSDIHITATPRNSLALSRISFTVAARPEGDDSERPDGLRVTQPAQEYAELAQHVVVEVTP